MAYNMDSDRRSSNVDSYYGSGRQSGDRLNEQARTGSPHQSFAPGTAGYNRSSYFDAGREAPVKGADDEEQGISPGGKGGSWDVFADFNNAGPRYSDAYGARHPTAYQQIPPSPRHEEEERSTLNPVELVTVPALGAEWKASELRDMKKAGKAEKKQEYRSRRWKEFTRGSRGLFGRKWLTGRVIVFGVFGLCVAVGIILAFTIPRVPDITFLSPALIADNSTKPLFPRSPTNFSFSAFGALQVDTGSNFLPLAFKSITGKVFDIETNMVVATGEHHAFTIPAKQTLNFEFPLNFTYVAQNTSDLTWLTWYDACRNPGLNVNTTRPGLPRFELILEMNIAGLVGTHGTSLLVEDEPCPVTLPLNAG